MRVARRDSWGRQGSYLAPCSVVGFVLQVGGAEKLPQALDPKYLKLLTSSNFWPFMLIFVLMLFVLLVMILLGSLPTSMKYVLVLSMRLFSVAVPHVAVAVVYHHHHLPTTTTTSISS